MHILLTDVLTCPRCGPEHGLIVLADRVEDRRVLEGRLGCANCREEYLIGTGVADLRFPPGSGRTGAPAAESQEEAALRLAALLGARGRPGTLLLLGPAPDVVDAVAELLPEATLVAELPPTGAGEAASRRASWVRIGERLAFRDRSLRGVAMTGGFAPELLEEAVRVLSPGAHLVLDPAPAGAAETLRRKGLGILLEEQGVVVASVSSPG